MSRPTCCISMNLKVSAAEADVAAIARQLSRRDTPAGRKRLRTAQAALAENRKWASDHEASHAEQFAPDAS